MLTDLVNPNSLTPNQVKELSMKLAKEQDLGAALYLAELYHNMWEGIKEDNILRIRLGLDRDVVSDQEIEAKRLVDNLINYIMIERCGKDYMKLPEEEFESIMNNSPEIQRANELIDLYGSEYKRELSLEDFE